MKAFAHDLPQVFLVCHFRHKDFCEAATQTRRQFLLAGISGWVHTRKQAKLPVTRDCLGVSTLSQAHGASVAVEQTGQAFQCFRRGQVDLIQQDPVAIANGSNQRTLYKRERE